MTMRKSESILRLQSQLSEMRDMIDDLQSVWNNWESLTVDELRDVRWEVRGCREELECLHDSLFERLDNA